MTENKKEFAYWIALAHLPKMSNRRKNEIIIKFYENDKNIIDFFHSNQDNWADLYSLNKNEVMLFSNIIKELPNYSFLVEDLLDQGYDIIPITSPEYPQIMKNNLKRTFSPPLVYTKGNKQILKENSIAIVGSRKADNLSLDFTDNIAKKASENYKVVVSGFAKGVDKQALDSSLKYKGQSIIVLPQGITTFNSGYKKYYKQIIDGDVLVLSTFFPKAPWMVQLAMARNPIIYGLASEIYVAESSEKGGTWSGVIDGLRKGRKIYVRIPSETETNANNILIKKGAIPVNNKGLEDFSYSLENLNISTNSFEEMKPDILKLLSRRDYSSKEIINNLKIDLSTRKLTDYLKNDDEIITIDKSSPLKFSLKDKKDPQQSLFAL